MGVTSDMRSLFSGKTKVAIIIFVLALLFAVVSLCMVNNKKSNDSSEVSEKAVTENKTTTYEKHTEETQSSLYVDSSVFPKEIQVLFETNKSYLKSLIENDCQQLIVVDTHGEKALVNYYSFANGNWKKSDDFSCSAFMGKNGSTTDKTEGDGCTPLGVYKIKSAFYINEKPKTALDSFKITEDSYWVDDIDSAYYNQYVTDIAKKDWDSAEHMIEYDGYRYGFVVDYNPTCEPNVGSAIFFHVGYNPTAGCVATNEEMVLKYLSVLDKEKNPFILIV